jgi:hypothetical protein
VTQVSAGATSSNGVVIQAVTVEFVNNSDAAVTLFSTQWRMQRSDGTLVDTFFGVTSDGAAITSNFEAQEIGAGGSFTGHLFFEASEPAFVVYQPSALAYDETLLVTWAVPPPATNNDEGQADEGQAATP